MHLIHDEMTLLKEYLQRMLSNGKLYIICYFKNGEYA